MQRVNEFVFYELALKVHKLTEIPNEVKYSLVWNDWAVARDGLDEIYRQRPLNFSTPVATKLYQKISEVIPTKFEDMIAKLPAEGQDEPNIAQWTVYEIREAAKEFETVLRNECHVMDTYFISKKGVYSTLDLIEHAHYQIPEPTRSRLPNVTKLDFDQAGKCIALDVPTAAAFHLLRGTEAVVREYYLRIVPGPKQASPKMRNWGTYIRLLKNHNGKETITSLLMHMKDVYRNPVFHPEETYTDERVLVLFGVCISAVVLIESELSTLDTTGLLAFPSSLAAGATG